eukprot:CAMPEP_0197470898 /NCGR_PEP_ID=MMETSP1309-20131121/1718_1 /TAXON_ID=464262 /ORGANISM="Genus nov. species nov., Strain RCC998" /LENGTH=563 /DNA_ID=CAMNT_0043008167 /DNA_START=169 /DNA_END=1860 /DNA_ORIENTATION=-
MGSPVETDVDVLVVGAGPVGLTLANELARRSGITLRIVDAKDAQSKYSKAMAVQSRSLEIYDDLGIAQEAEEKGFIMDGVILYGGKGRMLPITINSKTNNSTPYPGVLIFPQSDNEELLAKALKCRESGNKGVEYNTKLVSFEKKEGYIEAKLQDTKTMKDSVVRTKYIVGTDGAHSVVRHELKLPFYGKKYEEEFVLVDCEVESDDDPQHPFHKETNAFTYLHDQLFVKFPYGDGTYRIMLTRPKEQEGTDCTLNQVQKIADSVLPVKVTLKNPTWISVFRLHSRAVDKYGDDERVFLAGDAAHIHSPVGGQGMNTGIQDAYNLGWKLAMVIKNQASEKLLKTYNEERHPVGAQLIQTTDRWFTAMASQGWAFDLLKTILFSGFGKAFIAPLLGTEMPKQVSMLKVAYPKSSLCMSVLSPYTLGKPSLSAGQRFPYLKGLKVKGGNSVSTHDILRGTHFSFFFIASKEKDLDQVTDTISVLNPLVEGGPGVAMSLLLLADKLTPPSFPTEQLKSYEVEDKEAFKRNFGITSGCVLVRPDGYVGYIEASGQKSKLAAYIKLYQ